MGVKALIYFEVVTTFALLIGWVAITISRAGEGIVLPPPPEGAQVPQTAPHTWQDTVLQIFPQNIARAVVEAQMLQIVVFSVIFAHRAGACSTRRSAARCCRSPRASPRRCSGSRGSSC